MSNRENPGKGSKFQRQVKEWFEKHHDGQFELEKKIPIGVEELKEHKFDIVSEDELIVIECKRYTWTETGNVPSAKMGFVNEAAFYLHLLGECDERPLKKYIVMLYSTSEKRNETLAEYYYRTNKHLLGDIQIAEFNPETEVLKIIQ